MPEQIYFMRGDMLHDCINYFAGDETQLRSDVELVAWIKCASNANINVSVKLNAMCILMLWILLLTAQTLAKNCSATSATSSCLMLHAVLVNTESA
jgi:hypothetical protein